MDALTDPSRAGPRAEETERELSRIAADSAAAGDFAAAYRYGVQLLEQTRGWLGADHHDALTVAARGQVISQ